MYRISKKCKKHDTNGLFWAYIQILRSFVMHFPLVSPRKGGIDGWKDFNFFGRKIGQKLLSSFFKEQKSLELRNI